MSTPATPQASVAAAEPPAPAEDKPAQVEAPLVPDVAEDQPDPLPKDPAAIKAFLSGKGTIEVGASALEKQPAAAPVPPAPEPAAPAPAENAPAPAPVATAQPGDEERIIPRKINTTSIDEVGQRALAMQHSLNGGLKPTDIGFVPLEECISKVKTHDARPEAQPAPAAPSPVATLTAKEQELTDNLANLRQQRADMAASGTEYNAELDDVQRQIDDAIADLADAKSDRKVAERDLQQQKAQQQKASEQQQRSEKQKVIDATRAKYPSLNDKASPLYAEVAALRTEMDDENHPDNALLYTNSAADFLASRAAEKLATANATKNGTPFEVELAKLRAPAAAPAAARVDPPTPPKVSAISGAVGTPPPAPAAQPRTDQEILAEIGTDANKAREALNPTRQGRVVFRS